MKITYSFKEPKDYLEKVVAAIWNFGVPLFFLPMAGIAQQRPLSFLFFFIGCIPLFIRFKQ